MTTTQKNAQVREQQLRELETGITQIKKYGHVLECDLSISEPDKTVLSVIENGCIVDVREVGADQAEDIATLATLFDRQFDNSERCPDVDLIDPYGEEN